MMFVVLNSLHLHKSDRLRLQISSSQLTFLQLTFACLLYLCGETKLTAFQSLFFYLMMLKVYFRHVYIHIRNIFCERNPCNSLTGIDLKGTAH